MLGRQVSGTAETTTARSPANFTRPLTRISGSIHRRFDAVTHTTRTPRSHRKSRTSASATSCPITRGGSPSSGTRCTAASSGWRSPAGSPARNPGPTTARSGEPGQRVQVRRAGSVTGSPPNTRPRARNTSRAAWRCSPRRVVRTDAGLRAWEKRRRCLSSISSVRVSPSGISRWRPGHGGGWFPSRADPSGA